MLHLETKFWRGRHAANGYLEQPLHWRRLWCSAAQVSGTMGTARAMAMALAWVMPLALAFRVDLWKHWFRVASISQSCEVPL